MKRQDSPVGEAIELFIRQIDSLRDGLPIAMTAMQRSHRTAHRSFDQFVKSSCERTEKDGKPVLKVPNSAVSQFEELRSKLSKIFEAYDIVARSFLVSIVSQYDAYIGRLVRALFGLRPELLNSSERSIAFSDLSMFKTIDEAKENIIEFEVESLLRKSHKEQIVWLEQKFDLTLRKDLPVWPKFIEVTQRRNIFVHCDAIVSKQYLQKCKEDQVKHSRELKAGDELSITREYFDEACDILFEIGVKLSQVLWRKVCPSDLELADTQLNTCAYDLIRSGEYKLAINLLNFACEGLKKHTDEKTERMMIVNRANAYKLSGNLDKAHHVMATKDWTATSDLFQLSAAALNDDIDSTVQLMIKIGHNSEDIDARGYREWPLFKNIRTHSKYKAAFKKVFKEPIIPARLVVEEQSEVHHTDDVDSGTSRPDIPPKKKVAKFTVH